MRDLSSLTLNLGEHTTAPLTSIGVSLNFEPFYTVNVSEGANVIPLSSLGSSTSVEGQSTVVRITTEGWQNNRINLESIELNSVRVGAYSISSSALTHLQGAKLLPFTPSRLAFQVIGDSLSAVSSSSLLLSLY